MAFIHTNNLTGNDTTGNGSTGTPYKTIGKALSVALSGDFIKVAGGQWTAVAGDFTFTNSGVTVQTSTSQVGIIAVNDILTFEDGQFGFDKFHVRVTAVSASNLTIASAWSGPTQVVSGVYKLDAYHYSTGTNSSSLEQWPGSAGVYPSLTNPNGRTGITISGGWSSDFTTQNGWTVGRSTNASSSGVRFFNVVAGAGNVGDWRENLIIDRIMMVRIGTLFQTSVSAANLTANQNSCSLKEIAVIGQTNTDGVIFSQTPVTNKGSVYNVDSSTPVNFYVTPQTTTFYNSNINPIALDNPSASLDTSINLWANLGTGTTGAFSGPSAAIAAGNTGLQGSPNKITLNLRSSYVDPSTAFYANTSSTSSILSFNSNYYFKKINIYCNKNTSFSFLSGINSTVQIEDIEFLGPNGSNGKNGLGFGNVGQMLIDLSAEGKIIEDFKPSAGQTFGSTGPTYLNVPLSTASQLNLSLIQVKDAEGLKTMDSYGSIYFKDTTNGWLRVSSNYVFDNINENAPIDAVAWKVIGVNEKPNTPFTVTFRLKDDGNGGGWNTIGLQYGPNTNQIVTETISLTSSFEDYYITVDPATITDWNEFTFPLYCGIASPIKNINSNSNSYTNCFVQNISIS